MQKKKVNHLFPSLSVCKESVECNSRKIWCRLGDALLYFRFVSPMEGVRLFGALENFVEFIFICWSLEDLVREIIRFFETKLVGWMRLWILFLVSFGMGMQR